MSTTLYGIGVTLYSRLCDYLTYVRQAGCGISVRDFYGPYGKVRAAAHNLLDGRADASDADSAKGRCVPNSFPIC